MVEQRRSGWRERRKEGKRAKAERMGDTPEKQRERAKPERSVKDNAKRAGLGGFLSGGSG